MRIDTQLVNLRQKLIYTWHTFWTNHAIRCQGLIILAGSAMLNLVVYGRGLPNGFVAEDFNMMALTTLSWAKMWQVLIREARIKPLPLLLNKSLYPLFGTSPAGYHLVNLVLHAICTWCVVRLVTLLSGRQRVGMVAGLLFAVYPRHHQTVLWLAANQFVIATLLGLLALVCFGKYLQGSGRRYYLLTWVCSLFTLLTNEAEVMFLFLLPLIEWALMWPTLCEALVALRNWRTHRKYWPFLILLVAFLGLTFGSGRFDKLTSNQTYHFTGWGGEQVRAGAAYLVYLLFPQIPLRSLDVSFLSVALAALVALGLGVTLVKGTAIVRLMIVWIVAALAPYVFFVPFGNADRYFYCASAALCILVAHIGSRLYDSGHAYRSLKQSLTILVTSVYLLSSVALIQHRIGEWRRAGKIAADVVKQAHHLYPLPPAKSTMLFVDLPGQHGQAYVFLGGGIGGAVYLAYGTQRSAPRAWQSRDPAVISFLKRAEPVKDSLPEINVFLYQDGILYDKSNVVNSLESLHKGTWYR